MAFSIAAKGLYTLGIELVSIITLFWMELTNNFSRITIFPNFHECDSTSEN